MLIMIFIYVMQDFTLEEMHEGYMGSLSIISYKCMWIYNYLKIKSLTNVNDWYS